MDKHQKRQILEKARAAVDPDRLAADAWEHRQWREQHRDRYGILNLGQDEEIEPTPQQQRSSDEMVYKTFETPAPALTDAQIFNDEQAEALGYVIAHLRIYTREYVDQKLGELRAEIEVLSGVVRSNNVEMIKKRGSNVA